ncbi:nitrate ABC transporter permease [Amycolatopsis albispora]|uniref:Nitrate ABC transporter permease n=1 Tax=Amycolatopsis albispora TaxID=1804986 RepID=A0A344LKJ9_9PSEU|nr:nitrate ABC transporter permease [Amycolatopsis albispora]
MPERKAGAGLRGRTKAGVSGFLRNWLLFIGLVVLWELATRVAQDPFFPPPSEILSAAGRLWFSENLTEHILPSIGRMLGGWLIAVVLGVGIGVALGRTRTGMDYAGPLFSFGRSIPPPTLAPVFLVLFGIGPGMQLATIIFGALFPILLNTVDGVRSVDAVKVDTARSFRSPRRYWLLLVVLPAASPKIFAGLRLSLSISMILMVVSELIGAFDGIGYALNSSRQIFDFPGMWAWIVLLGILGYGFNTALLAVERRVLRWQPSRAQQDANLGG